MKPADKPLWLHLADNVGWESACRVASSLREDTRDENESIMMDYIEVLAGIFRLKSGAPL